MLRLLYSIQLKEHSLGVQAYQKVLKWPHVHQTSQVLACKTMVTLKYTSLLNQQPTIVLSLTCTCKERSVMARKSSSSQLDGSLHLYNVCKLSMLHSWWRIAKISLLSWRGRRECFSIQPRNLSSPINLATRLVSTVRNYHLACSKT